MNEYKPYALCKPPESQTRILNLLVRAMYETPTIRIKNLLSPSQFIMCLTFFTKFDWFVLIKKSIKNKKSNGVLKVK
jgi:hypothetical protein